MAKKKKTKKKIAKKRRAVKGVWTKDDIRLLKKEFPNNLTAEVAAKLGRKTDAVKKKASRMGISKTKRYLKSIGRA